ncbi:hypothetical protein [Gordonia westfalica]|uniref:Uncharacterized protein n=1 Tax=Gordonia westfalica TaxID=158898 RepID=A0A1H2JT93_9ACTN|nr:hypothetical protein [Gordonia westfalica]SDU59729.1 hypothetical protein SAMN04488548_1342492 [Gordonia westfalica]
MPAQPVDASVFHALVLLNLLFVTGAWCLARPTYRAAATLAVLSVMWLFGNGPIEGRVLISISIEHGLTESDILTALGLIISAITFMRTYERRRYDD